MTTIPPNTDITLPTGSNAPTDEYTYDVIVVGGGLAGLCAALSAARYGKRTALVQDRAVLGGNASSEIRMWALGAGGSDNRESGIMEEIRLANLRFNPDRKFSIWDNVLYGLAHEQNNLDLFLSCAVCELDMADETTVASVRAWHLTRQRWQKFHAKAFIDCSGDSILRLSGAPCRWGREAESATGESLGKEEADRKTMGNTILIQLREINPEHHEAYIAPPWALEVNEDTFPNRQMKPTGHNFWWLELGGMIDTINDADNLRDDLVALAHGVWAFIKNHPDGRGHNWELEWIGALPGKRENIRYEGDHILTQNDIDSEGHFDDIIAHGGWTMDDHLPEGIYNQHRGTTHHKAPSPYGIPYRVLYSHKIENLWFAGRNISATHMAMSSTRVMATCATLGQAAGTAAAIAVDLDCNNRDVYTSHLDRLQRRLMDQDQWLPGKQRAIAPLTNLATITTSSTCDENDITSLTDGIDRRQSGVEHRWDGKAGDWIAFEWDAPRSIGRVRITADSKLSMLKTMPCSFPLKGNRQEMPAPLPRDLRIESSDDGETWTTIGKIKDNYCRLIEWTPDKEFESHAIRIVFERGWRDGENISVFGCEVGETATTGTIADYDWPRVVESKNPDA